jgi:hypothetical protein
VTLPDAGQLPVLYGRGLISGDARQLCSCLSTA